MCGIAGYIPLKGGAVDSGILRLMTDSISHRGPDDFGFFKDDYIGFGHRRLSIIDLSSDGHQPMVNEDGLVITYNGEIYNYLELREELENLGATFKTKTDTEVILQAYKYWGEQCSEKFNGMWAFAIYNPATKNIFCSRDHYGIKPFYYCQLNDVFAFGSEIRQLLPLFDKVRMNEDVVKTFLFASVNEPIEETFFRGVSKLPGGCNLSIDLENSEVRINPFYSLSHSVEYSDIDVAEAVDLFGTSLTNSIKLRLRSDVTVGSCLSGGLDSSSVASIASKHYREKTDEQFCAITAVSEESNNDESEFAKAVVDCYNMKWLTVKPNYSSFVEHLPEIVRAQEEPFGSCSIVMQYLVMKTAKENGITVLLDGQGGDEILLGYERYFVGYLISVYRKYGLRKAIKEFRAFNENNSRISLVNLAKFLVHFSSAKVRYKVYRRRHHYLKDFPSFPMGMRFSNGGISDIFYMQKMELMEYNLPKLLRFEDKNSMWHSIEARLPFLDPNTVNIALSLPNNSKINEGWTKYCLRKFAEQILPSTITWRKNKFGFEAPEDTWISQHHSIMLNIIENSSILNYLCNMHNVKSNFTHFDNETKWKLYSVALWEDEFKVNIQ